MSEEHHGARKVHIAEPQRVVSDEELLDAEEHTDGRTDPRRDDQHAHLAGCALQLMLAAAGWRCSASPPLVRMYRSYAPGAVPPTTRCRPPLPRLESNSHKIKRLLWLMFTTLAVCLLDWTELDGARLVFIGCNYSRLAGCHAPTRYRLPPCADTMAINWCFDVVGSTSGDAMLMHTIPPIIC